MELFRGTRDRGARGTNHIHHERGEDPHYGGPLHRVNSPCDVGDVARRAGGQLQRRKASK